MLHAEVVIIGKGVAACAMALALKKRGVQHILIAGREPAVSEDISETLPLAAHHLLCNLDIGHLVNNCPVSTGIISKWNAKQTLVRETVFEVFDSSWQLNKAGFVRDLHNQVIKENIPCITVSHLQNVYRDEKPKWRLQFKHGLAEYHVSASFVVDASGRNAVFARKQGANKIMFDHQVAVTGVFAAGNEPEAKITSFIESMPDGWCYSALSSSNTRFVSLYTDADILNDLQLNKKQQWLEYLHRSELFSRVTGDAKLVNISVCPASSHFTEPTVAPGWLAIGDACYSVDPLTSGGVFHALYTAISSADYLLDYSGGRAAALGDLSEANRQRFESYLQQRTTIYRSVTHFPGSKYWERRHERVSLSPGQLIQCREPGMRAKELETLNTYLSAEEWEELYALCRIKSPAHHIISNFNKRRPAVPVKRTILALQFLIERGIIVK